MPYWRDVRPGSVYNSASAGCRWCGKRLPLRRVPHPRIKARRVLETRSVPPLCVHRPLVNIVLKEAFCQRAIFPMQVLARHYGPVQAAVVPRSRVSVSAHITFLHVGNSFSFSGSVDDSLFFSGGASLRHACIFQVMCPPRSKHVRAALN